MIENTSSFFSLSLAVRLGGAASMRKDRHARDPDGDAPHAKPARPRTSPAEALSCPGDRNQANPAFRRRDVSDHRVDVRLVRRESMRTSHMGRASLGNAYLILPYIASVVVCCPWGHN
ncbi:hypothetical protein BD309DRAFT_947694 [Dichomitus squalens]|nr:hypothetical protein BD309DRAFT_947694 [Dichomitus squalens]